MPTPRLQLLESGQLTERELLNEFDVRVERLERSIRATSRYNLVGTTLGTALGYVLLHWLGR